MDFKQLPKRELNKYKRLFKDKQQQAFMAYLVNNYDKLRHEWPVGEQLITLEGIMQLLNNCSSLQVFWNILIIQFEQDMEAGREVKAVSYANKGGPYWNIESSIKYKGLPDNAKQLFRDLNNYCINAERGI